MNFAFTEEQEELRKTVRGFLEAKSAEEAVRAQMETETGFDPAVWSQMGEQMGLQGLIVPEQFGGSGYGYVELGIVLEEMGRSLLCAPFFSSVVLVARGGDEEKRRVLALAEVQEALLVEGGEITPTTPQEFAALIRSELQLWKNVVRQAGIAID